MLARAAIKRLIEPEEVAELAGVPVLSSRRRSSPARRSRWTVAGQRSDSVVGNARSTMSAMSSPIASSSSCWPARPPPVEFEGPLVAARAAGAAGRRLAELEQAKVGRAAGPGAAGAPPPPRGRAVRPVRHRQRPGRAARPGRRAARDRAPGPQPARRRRRLHDAERRRARRHLHAGHRRLDLGPVPAAAAAAGRRPGRPGGADRHPVRHRQLRRGRALPAHRRDRRRRRRGGAGRHPRRAAAARARASIGVLYAANRSARPFAREEVALLVSLAAHAAVAIDTARLLAETQAALAELSAAHTHDPGAQRLGGAGRGRPRPDDRAGAARRRRRGRRRGGDRGARRRAAGAGRRRAARWPGSATIDEPDRADIVEAVAGVADRGAQRAARVRSGTPRVVAGAREPGRAGAAPGPTSWSTPTSGSWSGPRWSPRCCCCSGAPSPRPRGGCAASCSTT